MLSGGTAPALDKSMLDAGQRDIRRQVHVALAKVTIDIGRRRHFYTAIAAVMELLNALTRVDDRSPQGRAVLQEALEVAVLVNHRSFRMSLMRSGRRSVTRKP